MDEIRKLLVAATTEDEFRMIVEKNKLSERDLELLSDDDNPFAEMAKFFKVF